MALDKVMTSDNDELSMDTSTHLYWPTWIKRDDQSRFIDCSFSDSSNSKLLCWQKFMLSNLQIVL